MELTVDECAELRALVNSADVPATVATRARIVLWRAENRLPTFCEPRAGTGRITTSRTCGGKTGCATEAGHVQGQQGPGVRGEGRRHRRALSLPARRRGRAQSR